MDKELLKKLVIQKLDKFEIVSKMRPIHFDILDEQIENVLKYENEYKNEGLSDDDFAEIVIYYLSQVLQFFEELLKGVQVKYPKHIVEIAYRGKNHRI